VVKNVSTGENDLRRRGNREKIDFVLRHDVSDILREGDEGDTGGLNRRK